MFNYRMNMNSNFSITKIILTLVNSYLFFSTLYNYVSYTLPLILIHLPYIFLNKLNRFLDAFLHFLRNILL